MGKKRYYLQKQRISKFNKLVKYVKANIIVKYKTLKHMNRKEKKNVVLYHAMTAYHFLECVADKLHYNKEKYGVFLISKYVSTVYPQYRELIVKGVFEHILIYDIDELSGIQTAQECEDKIISYYDRLLSSINITINECSEIHVAGAHHGFGSYVCLKNRPFYFYEEAAGLLSDFSGISGYEKSRNPLNHEITSNFGLFNGDNNLVIEKRCVIDSQVPNFYDERARNYEVVDVISKLSKRDLEFLVNFFNLPFGIPFHDNNLIILGQQLYQNGKHLETSEAIHVYQLLIDYYSKNQNVLFKPHPADLGEYEKFLEDVFVIRTKFPSEMLPFLPGASYQEALTINSTAVNNLKHHVQSIKIIGYYFVDFREIIHRCCISLELVKLLKDRHTNLFHFGLNNEQIRNFSVSYIGSEDYLTKWLPINHIPSNSISIIDNIFWGKDNHKNHLLKSMNDLDDTGVIIFLNQYNDYCFYDFSTIDLIKYIVPIVISKKKTKTNTLEDLNDEVIYVFCKNKEMRKKIQSFKFSKNLKYTGIQLEVNPMSDEQLEYKKLELRVAANEYKLQKLIEEKLN